MAANFGRTPEVPRANSFANSSSSLAEIAASMRRRVDKFLSEPHLPDSVLARVQRQSRISLTVIHEAFRQYRFEELAMSYNGGKDCLVLLVLFLAALDPLPRAQTDSHPAPEASSSSQTPQSYQPSPSSSHSSCESLTPSEHSETTIPRLATPTPPSPRHLSFDTPPTAIPAIYARPPHPFPAVESFVRTSAHTYRLAVTHYTTAPPTSTIKSVFAAYLEKHPGVRAIFVGTRRTDPHGERLTHFDQTDHGWPDFVRIHPVIDWHYAEIWAFIRHLGIAYCELYDEGYTSLGGINDTHPNPKLRKIESEAHDGHELIYRPAYELYNDQEERLGRR